MRPLTLTAAVLVVAASASAANVGPFSWLQPKPPLPGWKLAVPPSGTSALWYPRSLRPHAGDPYSVTVELRHPEDVVLVYVNAGPKTGAEKLRGWPAFRVHYVGLENHDVRKLAEGSNLRFNGGTGSCVVDEYTTERANHRYREIACFVQGRTKGSVIVAAALVGVWPRYRAELERIVSAWQVN